LGTIELAISKVRPGRYFPSLLQPRRRAEHALLAVVQEAWAHGCWRSLKTDQEIGVLSAEN